VADKAHCEWRCYSPPDTGEQKDAIVISVKDITDIFFIKETKKYKKELIEVLKINDELINEKEYINIPIIKTIEDRELTVNCPLLLGLDLPPRNNLKKLESLNPTIKIMTWGNNTKLEYAIIIESIGDIGIWSNYYSNTIFLR